MLALKELQKTHKALSVTRDHLAHVFEALGDPTRLKIFRLLSAKKDLCVTDVAHVCGMSVPAASYQLKILEMVGLVARERTGKMICYELRKDDPIVKNILKIIR